MTTTYCPGPALDADGRPVDCSRDIRADGMCEPHYRQAARCRERGEPVVLKPVRERGDPRRSVSLRVRGWCLDWFESEGARRKPPASAAEVAREILELGVRAAQAERGKGRRKKAARRR